MRGAQAGATVKLTYDWWGDGDPPEPGDFLVSDAGSGYLILKARATSRLLRFRYLCEKIEPFEIPPGARVCSLEWHRGEWGSQKRDQLDVMSFLTELRPNVGDVESAEVPCVFCLERAGHADWCCTRPVRA